MIKAACLPNLANELNLNELLQICSPRIEKTISPYLQNVPAPELKHAMEYTIFNGGKRLRPLLIYATGYIFDANWENLDIAACAVELIHTYSLIHDDLPCMDNSDLRRGKPTCHIVYNESTAVLTGDALHTLAMQVIASHPAPLSAENRLKMLDVLSKACGPFGMAAGQALDIAITNDKNIPIDLLVEVNRLKTGALFSACVELGHLSSDDTNPLNRKALLHFSHCIGLAFQIQDDILDVETTTHVLGKPQGIDSKNNKATFPILYGIQDAKAKVEALYQEALETIHYLGVKAQLMRDLVSHMLQRSW